MLKYIVSIILLLIGCPSPTPQKETKLESNFYLVVKYLQDESTLPEKKVIVSDAEQNELETTQSVSDVNKFLVFQFSNKDDLGKKIEIKLSDRTLTFSKDALGEWKPFGPIGLSGYTSICDHVDSRSYFGAYEDLAQLLFGSTAYASPTKYYCVVTFENAWVIEI